MDKPTALEQEMFDIICALMEANTKAHAAYWDIPKKRRAFFNGQRHDVMVEFWKKCSQLIYTGRMPEIASERSFIRPLTELPTEPMKAK